MTPNPKLVIVSGAQEGRSFFLDGEVFTIGRQEGNDLQLLEAAVSRRHCEIRRRGDAFELHDLDSSHGSFVNTLPVGRHGLLHTDFVQIGSTVLVFLRDVSSGSHPQGDGGSLVARSTVERRPEEIAELLRGDERAPSELRVLLDVATAVQESRDAAPLAERLLERVFAALPAERGGVLLTSPESDAPLLVAERGPNSAVGGSLIVSRTVLSRVLAERVALLWDDVRQADDLAGAESLERIEVRSLLAVPLAGRRDLHGVLYFESARRGAFTEAHLELAAVAGAIGGLALDGVRAFAGLKSENRRLRAAGMEHGLVGESAALARLLAFIERVAPVDSTVLLRGESGTGKELAARALHRGSPRTDGPFVAINCATLSETLLESELFGHERGAFTGAVARKIGKLEAADGGTLFLDEVGEIPPALQARLLRALQERSFERVGGTQAVEVDVRVIAATNRDLETAMREGSFREDLFYRLNVIAFTLPPLAARREDVALLARHFARLHGERLKRPSVGIDPAALRILGAYGWPGNIRQLSNAIERALVLGDGEMIRPEDLPDEVLEATVAEEPASDFQAAITDTKKRTLLAALEAAGGNAAAAARSLGLHPNSFRRLLRQLGLREGNE